jgi:hypothetical protein
MEPPANPGRFTPLDRAFWVALFRFWTRWRDTLVIVKPDTVIRWHLKGFRLYWRSISKHGPGRLPISEEVQALIHQLASENGWGARKIQAELENLGTEPKRTAHRSPWQHGTAERWVGSARRELLDHVIVFNEQHLRRLLGDYVAYYNAERVHTRLRDSPAGRPMEDRPSRDAQVVGLPRVGGLHHRYAWQEAA